MDTLAKQPMIKFANIAYGDAPYKDIESAHRHVVDIISSNKAGYQPIIDLWPSFPTMLTNALTGRFGYRVQQITVSSSSAADLTEEDTRLIDNARQEEEDGNSRD